MKTQAIFLPVLIFTLLISCTPADQPDEEASATIPQAAENETSISCELIASWARAKEFTRRYMDAMPAGYYDFQPTPEILSFAHEFLHLGCTNYRYAAMMAGGNDCSNYEEHYNDPELQSKEAVMAFVMNSYDVMIHELEKEDDWNKSRYYYRWSCSRECLSRKGFEHQSHHRGKAAIYLRLKGVAPPFEMLIEDWRIPKDITEEDWKASPEYQAYQKLIDTE